MRAHLKTACRVCVAVVAAAVLAPTSATAQPRTADPAPAGDRRPYRGIFNVPPDPTKSHALTLGASLFGAYDDNVLAGVTEGRVRDWRHQRSGTYGGAHGGLTYAFSRSGERLSFGAQSGAHVRYYDYGGDPHTAAYYNGGLNMTARLTRSTTLQASQGAAFRPGYSFLLGTISVDPIAGDELLAQPEIPLDPDLEVFHLEALHLTSMVTLTQRLSRHVSLLGGYHYRQVDFRGESPSDSRFSDYGTHAGLARIAYSRGLTQYATLKLGYGIRVTDRRDRSGRPRTQHDVQAGIDYGRPLSFSRRTSLSFSTGSTIAVREDLSSPESDPTVRARLTGAASLVHELGRTWTARTSYQRGLVFREGFDDYFFRDALATGIDGLVTRRLAVSAGATWSFARQDRPGSNRQTVFSASAQATYGLGPYLGLFARYLYYEYDIGDDIPLDSRIPRALERHAVRVGLSTSIPLIR
jgi:hypothetical protein